MARPASGPGAGFAEGGPLDVLSPGVPLAGFADDAHARLGALTDDELIGVLRAWRRQASWAQARELAAVAELARRRPADGTPPGAAPGELPARLSEFVAAEVAMALTLTGRAAGAELDLALDLAARPATAAALEAGEIDLPRAKIITSLLGPLSTAHADAVEARILPRASGLTTGQLSAALRRAILRVDPDAARRRREDAEREARVEHWADPEGTASLAGRNLPPAQALAASKRLTQIATAWRRSGAQGGMDLLRAHAYLMLLNGLDVSTPPASLLPLVVPGRPGPGAGTPAARPSGHDPGSDPGAGSDPAPGSGQGSRVLAGRGGYGAGEALPPLPGLVSLTVPLTTLLELGDAPGLAAGHGPMDAHAARQLARIMAGHRGTRWQIIVTSPDGQALAHGAARGPVHPGGPRTSDLPGPGSGWSVRVT
ncbi:MAG: 13E12 repeat family protein, partial [Kitasatospora sp.]|nr:13E12 repeat family protein [Kitasatospora sp.]